MDLKSVIVVVGMGDLFHRMLYEPLRKLQSAAHEVLVIDLQEIVDGELFDHVARHSIQLHAESVRDHLSGDIASEKLPYEVAPYFAQWYDGPDPSSEKAELDAGIRAITDWLEEDVTLGAATVRRCTTHGPAFAALEALKQSSATPIHVVVHVATGPKSFPDRMTAWARVADQVVLEKPALDREATTDQNLLTAVEAAITEGTQGNLSDHYTQRKVLRAWASALAGRNGSYPPLPPPADIIKVCVQLLEPAALPFGRADFYEGVGGAFGDMVSHELEAVRILLGLSHADAVEKLTIRELLQYRHARAGGDIPSVGDGFSLAAVLELGSAEVRLFLRSGKNMIHSAGWPKALSVDYEKGGETHWLVLNLDSAPNKDALYRTSGSDNGLDAFLQDEFAPAYVGCMQSGYDRLFAGYARDGIGELDLQPISAAAKLALKVNDLLAKAPVEYCDHDDDYQNSLQDAFASRACWERFLPSSDPEGGE